MADPQLFVRRRVRTRDHKVLGVLALFVGALAGRAILQATDAASTLGVGAGMRALIALAWLFVPAKAPKAAKKAQPGV